MHRIPRISKQNPPRKARYQASYQIPDSMPPTRETSPVAPRPPRRSTRFVAPKVVEQRVAVEEDIEMEPVVVAGVMEPIQMDLGEDPIAHREAEMEPEMMEQMEDEPVVAPVSDRVGDVLMRRQILDKKIEVEIRSLQKSAKLSDPGSNDEDVKNQYLKKIYGKLDPQEVEELTSIFPFYREDVEQFLRATINMYLPTLFIRFFHKESVQNLKLDKMLTKPTPSGPAPQFLASSASTSLYQNDRQPSQQMFPVATTPSQGPTISKSTQVTRYSRGTFRQDWDDQRVNGGPNRIPSPPKRAQCVPPARTILRGSTPFPTTNANSVPINSWTQPGPSTVIQGQSSTSGYGQPIQRVSSIYEPCDPLQAIQQGPIYPLPGSIDHSQHYEDSQDGRIFSAGPSSQGPSTSGPYPGYNTPRPLPKASEDLALQPAPSSRLAQSNQAPKIRDHQDDPSARSTQAPLAPIEPPFPTATPPSIPSRQEKMAKKNEEALRNMKKIKKEIKREDSGEDLTIVFEDFAPVHQRRVPEAPTLYLPSNGSTDWKSWTHEQGVEWALQFTTNEKDKKFLMEEARMEGMVLEYLTTKPGMMEQMGLNIYLFINIQSHLNRVVNAHHGFPYRDD